jgi:uncharacterized protein YecT (DUF1311 family)
MARRTKKLIRTVCLFALAFAPALASAQDDPPIDCAKTEIDSELAQCASIDRMKADDILNRVYKQAMADARQQDADENEISPDLVGAVKALKKAQRAWIDYRDGTCDGMGFKARGGTLEPRLIELCLKEMTEVRTKELRELMRKPGN